MARIQLRNTTVYIQDGFAGTANIDDVLGIVDTDTTIDIDAVVANGPLGTDIIPVGARFTMPTSDGTVFTVTERTPADGLLVTTNIVWTPAADASNTGLDDEELVFIAQRIEIKIGDGDVSWTEAKQFEYDLDRDQLDTVRQGEDVPLSVELAFTFEYVTSQTGKPITPVDALKNINGASEWISSTADINPVTGLVGDACEPYAVDIYIIHDIPCGTDFDQDFLFVDFRYESLDYSIADATIAVSGQCNVTDVVTTRAANIV